MISLQEPFPFLLFLVCLDRTVGCPGLGRIGEGIVLVLVQNDEEIFHVGGLRVHDRLDVLAGRARDLGNLGGLLDPGPACVGARKGRLRTREWTRPVGPL